MPVMVLLFYLTAKLLLGENMDKDWENEEDWLIDIKQCGHNIKHLKDPSEEICLATVKRIGYNIQFIKNPSEAVCMAAIKQNAFCIIHIKNLTDEMCIEAIKQNDSVITYLNIEKYSKVWKYCQLLNV